MDHLKKRCLSYYYTQNPATQSYVINQKKLKKMVIKFTKIANYNNILILYKNLIYKTI